MVDDECKEEYLSHRAVEYGVATHMLKREDAWCRCEDTDGCFTFGVFDGHGGAELSHKCSELLPAKLHDAASDRAIEDAFWEVDAELGRQALTQGTTASCLCIRPTEAGRGQGSALRASYGCPHALRRTYGPLSFTFGCTRVTGHDMISLPGRARSIFENHELMCGPGVAEQKTPVTRPTDGNDRHAKPLAVPRNRTHVLH